MKTIKSDKYVILFNQKTGVEITSGINGNPDPIVLDCAALADVGVMGNCSNNNCEFCYQGKEQRPNMSLNDYKSIVNQLKPYCNQIALGGKGDCNEHENFKEILEYTIENGIIPNYTTSGFNLTDEQVELSKKCGAVAVSIGNLQPYSFTAIKKLQDAKIKTNLHWVLSKKSLYDVISVLQGNDIWDGKIDLSKINAIVLLSFKNQGSGKDLTNWALTDNDVRLLLPYLRDAKTSYKVGADSCLFCKIGKVDNFTKQEQLFTDTCEASRFSIYVSCDMKMMPCSYGDRSRYGISLNTNFIKDIWDNSKVFNEFRQDLKKDPYRCPYGL